MAVLFVKEKVLVDILQVKNVLKTFLHSFQIWGSKPPNKSNEYEHEREISSNVRTVLVCRTDTDRNCRAIQNLSHEQNGALKIEIFWYVMLCQLETSYQCFKWLQCIHLQGESPELLHPEDECTTVPQKVGTLTIFTKTAVKSQISRYNTHQHKKIRSVHGGPVEWTTRYPDLIPMDIFF